MVPPPLPFIPFLGLDPPPGFAAQSGPPLRRPIIAFLGVRPSPLPRRPQGGPPSVPFCFLALISRPPGSPPKNGASPQGLLSPLLGV